MLHCNVIRLEREGRRFFTASRWFILLLRRFLQRGPAGGYRNVDKRTVVKGIGCTGQFHELLQLGAGNVGLEKDLTVEYDILSKEEDGAGELPPIPRLVVRSHLMGCEIAWRKTTVDLHLRSDVEVVSEHILKVEQGQVSGIRLDLIDLVLQVKIDGLQNRSAA